MLNFGLWPTPKTLGLKGLERERRVVTARFYIILLVAHLRKPQGRHLVRQRREDKLEHRQALLQRSGPLRPPSGARPGDLNTPNSSIPLHWRAIKFCFSVSQYLHA